MYPQNSRRTDKNFMQGIFCFFAAPAIARLGEQYAVRARLSAVADTPRLFCGVQSSENRSFARKGYHRLLVLQQ